MKTINAVIRVFQLGMLGMIAGVLLNIATTLGEMTFKVECHQDFEIERVVCFIMPITDLRYGDAPYRGDSA